MTTSTTATPQRRTYILGGGLAGLAAAYRLSLLRPGTKISVIEQEAEFGGLASLWQIGDFSADLGPHRIYTELPEIQALLPELISEGEKLTVPRKSELLLKNHFYRYPVQAPELLRHLGPFTVGRLGFSAVCGKLRGMVNSDAANYEDFMVKAFGRQAYRLIAEPYTRKVWKINPKELAADVARVRISAGNASAIIRQWIKKDKDSSAAKPTALKSFTYFKGGVQGLVKSLTDKCAKAGVEFIKGTTVRGLTFRPSGDIDAVICTDDRDFEHTYFAENVISTLPLPDLMDMVAKGKENNDLFAEESELLKTAKATADTLDYIGLILIAVMVDKPQVTPNSWIYFPEEYLIFNRAYEPKNFDPGMAPSGKSLLMLEVTSRWNQVPWNLSDAQITEQARLDLVSTGILKYEEIRDMAVRRLPHTYPLYTTDYKEKLETVFRCLERTENLVSTGRQGLFNHNNMDHSMLMGIRAADAVINSPNPAKIWYNKLNQFDHFRIVD